MTRVYGMKCRAIGGSFGGRKSGQSALSSSATDERQGSTGSTGRQPGARIGGVRGVLAKCAAGATAIVCLVAVFAIHAQEQLTGRVVSVTDGDTITVLDANKTQHRVRISGINAPEKGGDCGGRERL